MVTNDQATEFETAYHETRIVLLKAISEAADGETRTDRLNALAEAYAWVVQPGHSHG